MKNLLILVLLILPFSKHLRADGTPNVSIQLSPLAFLDFNNGSAYRLGTQVLLTNKWAASADFGGYFRNFDYLKNNRGFYSYFAVKYRFLNNAHSWLSLSYSYKQQSFEYHDTYLQAPDVPIVVPVQKYVNCISLNFEHDVSLFRKGYINFYAGLGVRFRNVHSFETKHQFDELKEGGDSQTLYLVLVPGKAAWLNLNFGMRVGFYLFK
jgi:opacity protein-like surface antigen